MTSFGQITVTDLNGWQARALRVLTDLQDAGLKASREPLDWTATRNGSLQGVIPRWQPRLTDNDRRAIFDEWVHVLDGSEPRETVRFEGGTRLTSVFAVPTNRGKVKGSIVVDFDEPDEDA
jgi:hypothetical protein